MKPLLKYKTLLVVLALLWLIKVPLSAHTHFHENKLPATPYIVPVDTLVNLTVGGGAILSAKAYQFPATPLFTWSLLTKPDAAPSFTATVPSTTGGVNIPPNSVFTVVGVYRFKVRAYTLSPAASAEVVITIVVKPKDNKLPVLVLSPDTTIIFPATGLNLRAWVQDSLDKVDITWTQLPTNPVSLTDLPRYSIKKWYYYSTRDTLKIGSRLTKTGVYVFKVAAKDELGASFTGRDSIVVTVILPTNKPPVIADIPDTTLIFPNNALTLTGKATDPDGTITKYAWEQAAADPLQATLTPSGASGLAITNLSPGVYHFILTVTDNGGATTTKTITVTIKKPDNKPPVITLASVISLVLPVDTVLAASANDPEGDALNYSWQLLSGPVPAPGDTASVDDGAFSVAFPNFHKRRFRIRNLKQGEYVFRLTVTDSQGNPAQADIKVVVNALPNRPPVVALPKDTTLVLLVSDFIISSTASDPDGDVLTYTWNLTKAPGGMTLNPINNNTQAEMKNMAAGTYQVQLKVSDGRGGEKTAVMQITVRAAETALKAKKIISPNGDGQNETWRVEGTDAYSQLLVTVINEQGKVVYSAANYTTADEWDGRNNGKDLPEGAYYYLVRDKDNNILQKGSLLLLR